jgi:tetratricopeptide (TPR) repeat protein
MDMHLVRQRCSGCRGWRWVSILLLLAAFPTFAADLDDVRKNFLKGKYDDCIEAAQEALKDRFSDEEWRHLLIRSYLATGKYPEAMEATTAALRRYSWSMRLRLLAHEVYLQNGDREQAHSMLEEINNLAGARSSRWVSQDVATIVALGQAALLLGADPKRVLDNFFDRAKKADPKVREVYLASGQLALDKNDADLAAKTFAEGLKHFPEDPDLHYGLAKAYASGERGAMMEELEQALEHNPNHVVSHLLLADHLIDAEEDKDAEERLEKALKVNPWHPEAWAYQAVLAHLKNDTDAEKAAREKGLKFWDTNPKVDHLIGRKLSQKYRFAEGAAAQRRALRFDSKYLPAKIQLAQDLLRLGDEAEGWRLAEEVHDQDGYDVTAFNLANLHETIEKFQTLTNADFVLRMAANEAHIYGQQALKVLQQAKNTLCDKYGIELDRPTTVEVFPSQKDFGVRTFGMPHNPGFLGVCFGPVVTANSPASQAGSPANWQAVLWHEFCHVVTLQMTRNKMPRWLSEGISVFEELQANSTWGQSMNPQYREMILGDDFTPLSKLSSAFLTPESDLHLQFAYFESYLVVEFLVQKYGLDTLKKVLADLGKGVEINAALATHTKDIDDLEDDFTKFARAKAEKLAPGMDWERPEPDELRKADEKWFAERTNNYYALVFQAKKLMREKQFAEAKAPLQRLLELYPDHVGRDNPYPLLAEVHRSLNETNEERRILEQYTERDADAADAYLRLMQVAAVDEDWSTVRKTTERFMAVNPLLPAPYRYLAQASEALDQPAAAIDAYRTMLLLDPPDPAEIHYRLARLLFQARDPAAKRHVLKALEEAPRYRDAHKLLLEIHAAQKDDT